MQQNGQPKGKKYKGNGQNFMRISGLFTILKRTSEASFSELLLGSYEHRENWGESAKSKS